MSNLDLSLKDMMSIDGAVGAAVVDFNSGMALGHLGSSKALDLQVAAAGNTEVVRRASDYGAARPQGGDRRHLLISISSQYHVIRPVTGRKGKGLFLDMALDRSLRQPGPGPPPPPRHRGEPGGVRPRRTARPPAHTRWTGRRAVRRPVHSGYFVRPRPLSARPSACRRLVEVDDDLVAVADLAGQQLPGQRVADRASAPAGAADGRRTTGSKPVSASHSRARRR